MYLQSLEQSIFYV